jgi:hypothetical protein
MTLLIPASFVHLIQIKGCPAPSPNQVSRYRVCLLVLESLRSRYPCAGRAMGYLDLDLKLDDISCGQPSPQESLSNGISATSPFGQDVSPPSSQKSFAGSIPSDMLGGLGQQPLPELLPQAPEPMHSPALSSSWNLLLASPLYSGPGPLVASKQLPSTQNGFRISTPVAPTVVQAAPGNLDCFDLPELPEAPADFELDSLPNFASCHSAFDSFESRDDSTSMDIDDLEIMGVTEPHNSWNHATGGRFLVF